jgi:hypothetical protein
MGQTLSEPVRDKHTESKGNDRLFYAVSAMQGWRISILLLFNERFESRRKELRDKNAYDTRANYSIQFYPPTSTSSLTTNYHA